MDTILVKKAFIDAYSKSFGNISLTCQSLGISRQTFYNWKSEDSEFALELENIDPQERFRDFLESKLVQRINEGDTAVLIFVSKCKLRSRGYIEKQEVDHTGEIKISVAEKRIS